MLDFAASQRRLEARGRDLAEKSLKKAEVEKRQATRAAAKAVAIEETQRARRLAQAAAEQAERDSYAAELERNRGVVWRASLQARFVPGTEAESRGIRRAADKLVLPRSAATQLLDAGASRNGAMFFEVVCAATNATTHAGLLECTGDEGQVGLPLAVAQSLWGPRVAWDETSPARPVSIKYTVLAPGSHVVLQPELPGFQTEIGDEIKPALEAALGARSTLTEGDWVWVQGHVLRVRELDPSPAASIVETDLEAEVAPSLETEARIKEEQAAAQKRTEAAARERLEAETKAQREEAAEAAAELARITALEERQARAATRAGALPPEPAAGPDTATCLIRCGDGSRHARRFLASGTPLQALFDFAEGAAAAVLPERYCLVLQYPRSRLTPEQADTGVTLADAGIAPGQNVLFVEAL